MAEPYTTTNYNFALDSAAGGSLSVVLTVAVETEAESPLSESQLAQEIYAAMAAHVGEFFTGIRGVRGFRGFENFPEETV